MSRLGSVIQNHWGRNDVRNYRPNRPARLTQWRRTNRSVAGVHHKKVKRTYKKKVFVKKTYIKKKGVYKYPKWFTTLAKGYVPNKALGTYYAQVNCGIDATLGFSFWKHMSVMDIDNTLIGWEAKTANATSSQNSGTGSGNAYKTYLCNLVRTTEMRNASPADLHLQFFALYPRRDMPVSQGATACPQIAPLASNAPGDCVITNPIMWTQPFTDQPIAPDAANIVTAAGSKIGYNNPAVTPYMNPTLCQAFKIRRIKVSFPDGKKSSGILHIGDTVRFSGTRKAPFMVSYNKFGLDAEAAYVVRNQWEVMRQTPLIFCLMRGTPSHDTTVKTNVGLGAGYLDIVQRCHYEVYQFSSVVPTTMNFINSVPSVSISEQIGEDIDAPVLSTLV
jgi:hypothetical protein